VRIDTEGWRHFWAVHLSWWWSDARLLAARAVSEFFDDHCPKLAAAISYYVLFSIFPLAILIVSASGAILGGDPEVRATVADHLVNALPWADAGARRGLETSLARVAAGSTTFGVLGIVGLAWSASMMMGALRHAINQAWDVEMHRPFLRGKIVDLGMVLGIAVILNLSFGVTLLMQVARRVSERLALVLGPLGTGATLGVELLAVLLPLVLTFSCFVLVYRFLPNVRTRVAYVWPGALAAALLFEVAKNGLALYLRHFADYDRVYGSLGAVVVFLLFVYVGANVVLFGAEIASEWPRIIHGHYDEELERMGVGSDAPFARRAMLAVAGLMWRGAERPRHIDDPSARTQRRQRRAAQLDRARRSDRAPKP
jgi:membrane protein